MNNKNLSPLLKQYCEIKKNNQEHIVFFRLGDFYEMFYEDAELVSKLLGIFLTKKQEAPMCGMPFHNVDFYIRKLILL